MAVRAGENANSPAILPRNVPQFPAILQARTYLQIPTDINRAACISLLKWSKMISDANCRTSSLKIMVRLSSRPVMSLAKRRSTFRYFKRWILCFKWWILYLQWWIMYLQWWILYLQWWILIYNDGFCIYNDEFCIYNDEFCIYNDEFLFTMMNSVFKMMDSVF